jgi:hypothetical protein
MRTQGFRLGPLQIWVRQLVHGAKAAALFNFVTDDVPQPITLHLKDLGFSGIVHFLLQRFYLAVSYVSVKPEAFRFGQVGMSATSIRLFPKARFFQHFLG